VEVESLTRLANGSFAGRPTAANCLSSRPIRFLHLEGLDRCDGHDAGVIHDDIDPAEGLDGSFDECLYFSALRDVDGEPDRLAARSRDLSCERVDPIPAPGSQYDLGSALCKKLRSAFSNAAARSSDCYDLAVDICRTHGHCGPS
jgi:hypothetical protein